MTTIEVIRGVPEHLTTEVLKGTLKIVGGVIRDPQTGRIVAHLREVSDLGGQVSSLLTGLLPYGPVVGILNLGVTTMGFAVMLQRLGIIERQLQKAQEVLSLVGYKIDLSILC